MHTKRSLRWSAPLASFLLLCSPLCAVDIVAHRGASRDAPENTLASVRLAWEQNADVVEIDVYQSKDGKIVVTHDANTSRTTGVDAEIRNLTYAEIRALDAAKRRWPQFAGERMPLLDEVIALTPAGKRLFVELKTGPEIVPELVRCMARTGAKSETITFISFHYETLKEVRRQLPSYPTQYVVGYTVRESSPPGEHRPRLDKIIGEARAAGLTGLDLKSTWPLTLDDARKIREVGLELHVWTVDDPALARHWIELGAQSLTTNRPGWLREQLKL